MRWSLKKKTYRHHLTNKLMEIGQNDQKMFWSIINQMDNWGGVDFEGDWQKSYQNTFICMAR